MAVLTASVFFLSYLLSRRIYMFWDVTWHIEGAVRMFHGGTYLTNLVDDNPPMTFIFFLPLALWKYFTGTLNANHAILYIYFTYLLSFILCYINLKNSPLPAWKRHVLYMTVVMVSLTLCVGLLGQRELNTCCLFTPYLLYNLFSKQTGWVHSGIVAGLAAIGITQAPFYLLMPLALDAVAIMLKQHQLRRVQLLFYTMTLLILCMNYLLFPGYFHTLLPLLASAQAAYNHYYTLYSTSIFQSTTLFCVGLVCLLCLNITYKVELAKLMLIIAACMLIYMLEAKGWLDHIFPAIYYTILTFAFIVIQQDLKSLPKKITIKGCIIVYLLGCLFVLLNYPYLYQVIYKNDKRSDTSQMIQFARSIPNRKAEVLLFSTRVTPTYLLSLYTGLHILSPWADDWLTPGILYGETRKSDREKLSKFYQRIVLQTMSQRPKYILYMSSKTIPYIQQKNFNYYNYLAYHMGFLSILKDYKSKGRIANFTVLERIDHGR